MAHIKQDEKTKEYYLADDWHIDDVLMMRHDLTNDEALRVLEYLANTFDANDGINWLVIESAIDYLYPIQGV